MRCPEGSTQEFLEKPWKHTGTAPRSRSQAQSQLAAEELSLTPNLT